MKPFSNSIQRHEPNYFFHHKSFTNEHGRRNPSFVDRRQLEVAFGRRQQERDAEDLDGVAGVGQAARSHQPVLETPETCDEKQLTSHYNPKV